MVNFDNVDFVFAAGNCGKNCPDAKCRDITNGTISGANAIDSVITVAGCNILDEHVGYSSHGPGIEGMIEQKPDLAGYTHFLGSEALGAGVPDKGTSTACPIVSGCIASLRTRLSSSNVSPILMKSRLRTTARQTAGEVGWNPVTGHGIVNPVAAAISFGLLPAV